MSNKERRLAAIMFTDIVGYSSMMQKDEEYANKMRIRHRQIFDRWHKQFKGKVLQYYGDGTLSIFNSTTDAVECAVAIQQSLKSNPKVPLRIGIHIGDITYSDNEVYGDGVNIASRIESLCVPGGVFISGKTYDDIKSHPRLKAKAMGTFPLKNIHQQIEIYAINNDGINVPEYEWKPVSLPAKTQKPKGKKGQKKSRKTKKGGKKSKWIAAILAFFFGIFGVHRFYLDQKFYGIIYVGLFFLAMFGEFEELAAIPAILGFIDFISFLAMPRDSFNAKYNPDLVIEQEQELEQEIRAVEQEINHPKKMLNQQFEKYYRKAKEEYKEYDYDNAIKFLEKAIEIKYDHPEAQFLLARCYSINEDAQNAIAHLEAAVAFGLSIDRIRENDDLAYLRIQPSFEAFEANNYVTPQELPAPSEMFELKKPTPELLEQLNQLQKDWEAGRLSDEEFELKQKELKSRK